MAQTSFPFDSPAASARPGLARNANHNINRKAGLSAPGPQASAASPEALLDAIGAEIGWDHAHHQITPPLQHLHHANPVRQGWDAGRRAFGQRSLRATPQVRVWLALRLTAWQHGQAFEGVQVSPHFLTQIEASHCPVTRDALTHATGNDSDGAVTRINTGAGYAAGNLARLSRQAIRALSGRDWAAALGVARSLTDRPADKSADKSATEHGASVDGLNAAQWQRLGVLQSLVTPLPHHVAAALPLWVLPPSRLRVLNPVQALQVTLTLLFTRPGYARQMLGWAALMPCSQTRQAFQIFMHTLLARRISAGVAGAAPSPQAARQAVEDSWSDALVNRRWQRLALRLSAAQCEQLLQRAGRRGLTGPGSRWVSAEAATEGWSLDTRGQVLPGLPGQPDGSTTATDVTDATSGQADARPCSEPSRTPGMARSLDSQKLAS